MNTSLVRVKRPVSYKLIWQASHLKTEKGQREWICIPNGDRGEENGGCSIWFPIAPRGYVAVGCVVSAGSAEPPLSSALCIMASLVSSCTLKDCIALRSSESYTSYHLIVFLFFQLLHKFDYYIPCLIYNLLSYM